VRDEKGGGKKLLSYYAPARLLLVQHTPAVQAKVDTFIKNIKQSLPTGKDAARRATREERAVVQAQCMPGACDIPADTERESARQQANAKGGYHVPQSGWARPKHLFHFIIRYEGEGIIDSTVADVLKAIYATKAAAEECSRVGTSSSYQLPHAPSYNLAPPTK